ncbi:hypothetical protein BOX15_Mlig029582g2, partial [Macrostomum lignano]
LCKSMLLPQLRRLAPLAYRGLSSQSAAAVPNSTPLQQTVTVVPGDGVFPELLDATKQVLKAAGAPLAYEQVYVSDVNRSLSQPLDTLMESIQRNKVALMGIMSHPTYGSDLASSSMRLRRKLDMFASCVNVRSMPGITSRHKSINLVIIREQTEGEYSALEHETVPGVVESLKIVTRKNSERIAKFAFDYAVKNGRKRVTAVHKANIMKLGDGLFLESCKEPSFPSSAKMLRNSARLLQNSSVIAGRFRRSLSDMAFTLASPGEVFYRSAKVRQVDVPTLTGSIGVLANHVPLLGCLKPGVVSVHEEDGSKKYFVSSGSVTINDDSSVQILAEELASLAQLDPAAARDGLAKAQQAANAATDELSRAEATVEVEAFEAVIKALDENK